MAACIHPDAAIEPRHTSFFDTGKTANCHAALSWTKAVLNTGKKRLFARNKLHQIHVHHQ
jgi:hypothetical protein